MFVEDTCRGRRVRKGFAGQYAARRFYAAKDRAGKNPKVLAAQDRGAG